MSRTPTIFAVLAALLGLMLCGRPAAADEEKIAVQDLPKVIQNALETRFPGGTIKQVEKEVDAGKTTYEVALTHDGHAIEASFKPDGTVIEVETAITENDLPKAVADVLKSKYAGAAIKKAEKIAADGRVDYEVILGRPDGTSVEVKLDAGGKILESEEDDEKN